MGIENGPSEEEMGLKPEETKVLNDADLIKGGARAVDQSSGQKRLEVTKAQLNEARLEMGKEKEMIPVFDLESQFRSMDMWLKKAEGGKNKEGERISDYIDAAGRNEAVARYIISRLSTEQKRRADEYFQKIKTADLSEDVPGDGDTMDEKLGSLQVRLYEARRGY